MGGTYIVYTMCTAPTQWDYVLKCGGFKVWKLEVRIDFVPAYYAYPIVFFINFVFIEVLA
jgi:hypothetical protein